MIDASEARQNVLDHTKKLAKLEAQRITVEMAKVASLVERCLQDVNYHVSRSSTSGGPDYLFIHEKHLTSDDLSKAVTKQLTILLNGLEFTVLDQSSSTHEAYPEVYIRVSWPGIVK